MFLTATYLILPASFLLKLFTFFKQLSTVTANQLVDL